MISERDNEETAAAKELSQDLRTRVGDHLEKRAEFLEHASTQRHIELVKDDEEELSIVLSVSDQHEEIVRRIAQEIKTPRSSIDDYRKFGEVFAATAVKRRLSLRDAINGLLFLKSEMLGELALADFLVEMDSMEVKGLVDFIGTRIDVLFAELAVSYHRNFTERLTQELAIQEKQNRQKDMFIRIASHEIRNPLANAMAVCELATLENGLHDQKGTTVNEKFIEINSNLLAINKHLTQLLDMSLLEDDKIILKKEKIDVLEVVEKIKLSFERIRKDRVVTLTCAEHQYIQTDPGRVDQILSNLLHNAAKYSAEGTSIELVVLQKGSNIVITVTDHGNGINQDDQERIFDPYQRLVKDVDRVEGLGLGLYISRTLAEALGGSLTVESTIGSGSSFILMLPVHHDSES